MPAESPRLFECCPVGCQAPLEDTTLVVAGGRLQRCPECGQLLSQASKTRYLERLQIWDQPRGTLPEAISAKRRDAVARRRLKTIATLLRKLPAESLLLDVGCSSGAFLQTARQMGFPAEGIDPAPQAARTAQAAGFRIYIGTLEEVQLPAERYAAVTLFEVLEHVTHPQSIFVECRRILKPEGLLVVGTGNTDSWTVAFMQSRWEYFDMEKLGGHISFFNPTSLRLLAERTGFTVERVETRNVRLVERTDVALPLYRLAKVISECLNLPARLFGKGHDMLVFIRRKS